LEQIKDGIQMEMFNGSLLKFERQNSFDSNAIGKIVKQNIELYFLENIENMRELDLISKIECTSYLPILQPFKSNSFLFLYLNINILNLLCLDKDGNTLFDKKDLIKNKKIEEITEFDFASSKNNKTLYICACEKHLNQTNEFFYLRSFDENFNLLAKVKLDKEPNDYQVNGENLFLLNKNENCSTISMYNHNLEIVQTFGQENSLLPYFFSPKITHFCVSNKYFIFRELIYEEDHHTPYHSSLKLINRSNGLVETSFLIYDQRLQMRLYLDKFLITFNDETGSLQCYNFKGDLLHKITLDKKFKGSNLSVLDKELCFFFEKSFCIL
jgi:hypothetical protein